MQRLTLSKSKSLDYEANYFMVSWTHLLFELGCLEGGKVWTAFKKGKTEAGIWSNVYTTCYFKGCELNNSETLQERFKACLTNEIKLSEKCSS